MALTLSNALRTAGVAVYAAAADAGSGPGKLQIYTGTKPAGPDTAVGAQVKLAEFTLNDPAFEVGATGVQDLDVTPKPTATGLAAGTAAWARLVDSNGSAKMDFTVSATGGGGDVTMNTTTVSVGLALEITAGTITQPA